MQEKIIILDFGSQTTQLIGRRVRELNTYCEIIPYNKFPHDDPSVIGVILSGSPFSVYDRNAFKADLSKIRRRLPVLGICYGAQFMAWTDGGTVEPAGSREYGRALLAKVDESEPIFKDIRPGSQVWMSHGDTITSIPAGFRTIASTDKVNTTRSTAHNCCATSWSASAARIRTGAPPRSSRPPWLSSGSSSAMTKWCSASRGA